MLNFDGTAAHYPTSGITIQATLHSNPAIFSTTPLTVANPVDHIVITPASPPTLVVCGSPNTQQFDAEAQRLDNSVVSGVPILWNSSKTSVADITSIDIDSGVATANDGTNSPTAITATGWGVTSTTPVSLAVSGAATIDIIITPSTATVPAGGSLPLSATATGGGTVSWSVDDASPPANGTVSPAGPNNATTYTAPASVPASNPISVRAISTDNSDCAKTANITVTQTFGDPTSGAPTSEVDLDTNHNPQGIVSGQFHLNSSTDLDVAVANADTDTVSILVGDGTGSLLLTSSASTTTGSRPVSITSGIFSSDALPDLATANFVTDDTAVLLGVGNGTFNPATPATVSAGTIPRAVTAADFDNPADGFDDLAVANYGSSDITILKSNGDVNGTFTTTQTIPLPGTGPWSLATGKINGDDNVDLVVADLDTDTVWVILGNGDGTFSLLGISPVEIPLPAGTGPAALTVADFDGDTFLDLAVVNVGAPDDSCSLTPSSEADKVTIIMGRGDGTFDDYSSLNPPITYDVGSNPRSIDRGDFNQDGAMDLVTANFCSDDLSLLFGVGDGTFVAGDTFSVGSNRRPTGVAVGNFNSNTDTSNFLDLAVSNSTGGLLDTGSVSVFLNNN